MNKIVFETYWYKGRKYCKFNGEVILVESSIQDQIRDLCKQCFKKFRIQFQNANKPSFLLYITKDVDVFRFEKSIYLLYENKVFYDIIRIEK